MQTVSAAAVQGKKVLLRMDLDVPLAQQSTINKQQSTSGQDAHSSQLTTHSSVADDFRLRAGLDTLKLCLENAESVIVMGHLGRPNGVNVKELSVAPVVEWFENELKNYEFPPGKFHILENLRFESGEDACDLDFAKELASLGNFFVNESFAGQHPAASTTVLPTLLPHAAGLCFAKEVETLLAVRNQPKKPLVVVIGGAKISDKLSVVNAMSKIADAVLIGGKLSQEIKDQGLGLPNNVMVGKLNDTGFDIAPETRMSFQGVIFRAAQVLWSGPMGKFEDGYNQGNIAIAEAIIKSGADSIVGGGDTIDALGKLGLLEKFSFVSTGGGSMLTLLATGTLPTIEALA